MTGKELAEILLRDYADKEVYMVGHTDKPLSVGKVCDSWPFKKEGKEVCFLREGRG